MTKNRWRSVDAHFHDGAGRVLLSVLPIKASKNAFMTKYDLSEVWFPRTHDQKLLTLRWRSVDAYFAMAVSTICNQLIWHSPSFTLFWLPSWCFHLLSSWSLRCTLIIHKCINNHLQNPVLFGHCSSSVAGSLNPLLLPSKWMLAALPCNR